MIEDCTNCKEWTLQDAEDFFSNSLSNIRLCSYVGAFFSGCPILSSLLDSVIGLLSGQGLEFGGVSRKYLVVATACLFAYSLTKVIGSDYRSKKNYKICAEHKIDAREGWKDKAAIVIVSMVILVTFAMVAPVDGSD